MNTQHSPRRIITTLAAIAGMIMITTTAQADWLSPAFYGDELDRCAAELRTELSMAGVTRLRHTVTDIDKVGVWYVFDIQTEMADDADTVIGQVKTRCRAHRWNERTSVEMTSKFPVSNTRIALAD
jgi:hypothetical protein